ncbi:MAG: hypothetical protein IJ634_04940 [Bacteroidales bacterium]|nr:hypothetical protein [Bacteroidales bacterium]
MNNDNLAFEQLQALLQSYDEKLRHIATVQEESIKQILRNSMQTNHRSLLNYEIFGIVFNLAFVAVFMLNYNTFIHDWRYLIPYMLLVICLVGNAVVSCVKAQKIKSFAPMQVDLTTSILNCERYILFLKREFLISTTINIIVCIFAVPPVCSKIKGWDYYQYNLLQLPFHLTVLGIVIVVAFGIDFWYYHKNRRALHQLKENISEYKELNNE